MLENKYQVYSIPINNLNLIIFVVDMDKPLGNFSVFFGADAQLSDSDIFRPLYSLYASPC